MHRSPVSRIEGSQSHYFTALDPWTKGLPATRAHVLVTLWASQPDPFAPRPLVSWTQAQLAQWTRLGERTIRSCLCDLRRGGAITRKTFPNGGVGYYLNRHPEAETDPRFGPFQAPQEQDHERIPDSTGRRTGRRRAKDKRQRFPQGVRPSDVAGVLIAKFGGPQLSYKGPEVCSAGETMVEQGWGLDALATVCGAYSRDQRPDKPPHGKLFYREHREATVARYGNAKGASPPSSPPRTARPRPKLTPERLCSFLSEHVARDEAGQIVVDHGSQITAMGSDALREVIVSWKGQPGEERPPLSSVFAKLFTAGGSDHGR